MEEYICECGTKCQQKNISRHLKSKTHLNFIENKNKSQNTDEIVENDINLEDINISSDEEEPEQIFNKMEFQRKLIKKYSMMLCLLFIKHSEMDDTFNPINEIDKVKERLLNIIEKYNN